MAFLLNFSPQLLLVARLAMLLWVVNIYSEITVRALSLTRALSFRFVQLSTGLHNYYRLNDLMWQDGLLIDFLQKKVVDKWMRRFLVFSSYLVSERIIFEIVVRFYIDLVVWPSTLSSVFDFVNVSLTLSALISTLIAVVLLFNVHYMYLLLL